MVFSRLSDPLNRFPNLSVISASRFQAELSANAVWIIRSAVERYRSAIDCWAAAACETRLRAIAIDGRTIRVFIVSLNVLLCKAVACERRRDLRAGNHPARSCALGLGMLAMCGAFIGS